MRATELEAMQKGTRMLKLSAGSAPQQRDIMITEDGSSLYWKSSRKSTAESTCTPAYSRLARVLSCS